MNTNFQVLRLNELEICVSSEVYQPSDDSFLITDYIVENPDEFTNKDIIDIGSGTGILSLVALKMGAKYVLAIDINPYAVQATKCTLQINGFEIFDVVRCESISCLRDISRFEVALYNPPYLPIDVNDKECSNWLAFAWCGGPTGKETVINTLEMLKSAGLPRKIVLVLSTLGDYLGVINKLFDLGYKVEHISSRRFFFEEIKLILGVLNGKDNNSRH